MEQHTAKFEIGDWVEVITDKDSYPHCIGKTGIVVSGDANTWLPVYVVEFDFELPPDTNVVGKNKRQFFGNELQHSKEYKVLQILRQYEANTKRGKGF